MGNAEIDKHILGACGIRLRKVARIIVDVGETTGLGDKEWGYRAIAKRIRTLGKKGRLEGVGNLWNWRASEIRLPQKKPSE